MTELFRNKHFPYLYCTLLALIGLFLYSYSTLPFYVDMKGLDSSVFQVIGREWSHGSIPYIDFWDNKGPIVYFIDCLGYIITNNSLGIFIIQFIFLSITLVIFYNIFLCKFSKKQSCLLLLIPIMSLVFNGWVGNNVEEYLLPLLSTSYFLVYKWLNRVEDSHIINHPPLYAFVYGLTFAFCLLTRLTNVIGIATCVLVIFFVIIKNKQWINLEKNIISFLFGFCVLIIPFVAYFWSKGALREMINSSFLINILFFSSSGIEVSLKEILYIALHFMDTWLILFTGLIMLFFSKRRISAVTWTLVGLTTSAWIFHSYAFSHYGVISLPLIPISFIELKRVYDERCKISIRRLIMIGGVLYTFVTSFCFIVYRTYYFLNPPINSELSVYRNFMKDVPSSFRESFVGYNIRADYYLYDNIRPSCKFFACQDIQPDGLDNLTVMKREAFLNGVKWIMVKDDAVIISQILKDHYSLVKLDKLHGLSLYHIKKQIKK